MASTSYILQLLEATTK